MFRAARFLGVAVALFPVVAVAMSCRPGQGGTDAAPPAASSAAPIASASADEEEVRPVYPMEEGAPKDPLAERLCTALHEVPERHRSECCKSRPRGLFTSECVRTLSYALSHKAVTLSPADVDNCAAAIETTFAGCDWVGPFAPLPPDECTTLIKGALALGSACRSSLECTEPMRCHGVGPTTLGRCGPPREVGGDCGGTVDTLATYTRADVVLDRMHPTCKDTCNRRLCIPTPAEGSACKMNAECGPTRLCLGAKCTSLSPAKAGQSCISGLCDAAFVCIGGKCADKKGAGESCTSDMECRAGCVRPDGGKAGTCGMKCRS